MILFMRCDAIAERFATFLLNELNGARPAPASQSIRRQRNAACQQRNHALEREAPGTPLGAARRIWRADGLKRDAKRSKHRAPVVSRRSMVRPPVCQSRRRRTLSMSWHYGGDMDWATEVVFDRSLLSLRCTGNGAATGTPDRLGRPYCTFVQYGAISRRPQALR